MKRVLALLALLASGLPEAQAAGFFASGMASGFCPQQDDASDSQMAPVGVSGACTNLTGTAQFAANSGQLFAPPASFSPNLGTYGTIGYSNAAGHLSSQAQARAGFSDQVTLPAGDVLHLEWEVDGREVTSGAGSLDVNATGFRVLPGDVFAPVLPIAVAGDTIYFDDHVVVDLTSTGSPITVQPELLVNMSSNVQLGDTRTYHSFIDLGHTARLRVAEVRDAQGHALPDVAVISDLGIDYLHAAPEPGARALASLSAAALALLRGRARSRATRLPS